MSIHSSRVRTMQVGMWLLLVFAANSWPSSSYAQVMLADSAAPVSADSTLSTAAPRPYVDTLPRPPARFFSPLPDTLFGRNGIHQWPSVGSVGGDASSVSITPVPVSKRVAHPRRGKSPMPILALLGGLVLVAGVRAQRPQELAQTLKSPFSHSLTDQHLRDQPTLTSLSGLALDFVFILCAGILGALALARVSAFAQFELPVRMGLVLAGLAGMVAANQLGARVVGWLMRRGDAVRVFLFHGNVFLRALGLVLLPVALVALYAPAAWGRWALPVAGALWATCLALRLLRLLRVGLLVVRVPAWHFIVYLCALEILPLLLLIKYFIHGQF